MKQSFILRVKELFPGSEIVRKYAFKTTNTRDSYAHLARANRQLSQKFANAWAESVHLDGNDCFECLSPHEIAA